MSATMEAPADWAAAPPIAMETRHGGAIEPTGGPDDRRAMAVCCGDGPGLAPYGNAKHWFDMGSVDLSVFQTGRAPLLIDHCQNVESQIGVIERAGVVGSLLYAELRFARTRLADEVLAKVRDGICRNISVSARYGAPATGLRPGERIKHWTPFELSVIAVPCDWRARILDPAEVPPDLVKLIRDKARAAACGSPATWRGWVARAAPALADRLGCDPALAGGALAEAIEAELLRAADEAAP